MSNQRDSPREFLWSQVDVFAEAPLQGNMLAIFHDARGLSDSEMQALARETNLSETTFILPRGPEEEAAQGVRVRIFTTAEELPFAGHPTLGTASWLWLNHPVLRGSAEIRLELNSGTVAMRFLEGSGPAGVLAEMTQHDPVFGAEVDRVQLAPALGLQPDDLLLEQYPHLQPQVVSTGLPFLVVPVRSAETVSRVAVQAGVLQPLLQACGAHFPYCIAPIEGADAQWHARMPFYGADDPATGSAAGCAVSYLLRHRLVQPDQAIAIRQGVEVHRPSRIVAKASLRDESVTNVRVSGRTIPVATGRFILL